AAGRNVARTGVHCPLLPQARMAVTHAPMKGRPPPRKNDGSSHVRRPDAPLNSCGKPQQGAVRLGHPHARSGRKLIVDPGPGYFPPPRFFGDLRGCFLPLERRVRVPPDASARAPTISANSEISRRTVSLTPRSERSARRVSISC